MKIRVIQSFNCYEKGQVFEDWPGGMCDILIGRGLIEEVKDTPAVETAAVEHDTETADATPRKTNKRVK